MVKNENGRLEETIKGITYEIYQYPDRAIEYVVKDKNDGNTVFSGNESATLCFFEDLHNEDLHNEESELEKE